MHIQNRNLFRLTRLVLLRLPAVLRVLAAFRKPSNKVLIIKLDAIGDYILFRNFLEAFKTSAKFNGHRIDLLGNEIWKDIALSYDSDFISEFIFIKPFALYENPLACLKLGWKLFKNNYMLVLQPTYSRTLIADGLAGLTAARQITGFLSDEELILKKYKKKTDKFYTTRLLLPPPVHHEFERNRFFFKQVTGSSAGALKPAFPVKVPKTNHIVFFTGAGYVKREWGLENFLALAKLIIAHTSYQIVFAGGKSELAHAGFFAAHLPAERIINLTGKTSLPQLVEEIAGARCVISNDTSAVHIAAACNTPVICIHGVAHYKRFIPYPDYLAEQAVFVYEEMPCLNCNWTCVFETEETAPFPCIAVNTVEKVWLETKKLLAITETTY